ncbi:hypothetical protein QD153_004635 [Salmonella enterica]|nr:hypothetical protein [Salmonella enterica]
MDWLTGMSVYILFRGVNKRRGHCIDNVLQSDKSGFTALQLYSFTALQLYSFTALQLYSFTALQLRQLLWVLLICRWPLFPNYPEFRVKCVCSYHLTMKKVGFWTGNVVIFF